MTYLVTHFYTGNTTNAKAESTVDAWFDGGHFGEIWNVMQISVSSLVNARQCNTYSCVKIVQIKFTINCNKRLTHYIVQH